MRGDASVSPARAGAQLWVLLGAVFCGYTVQQMLIPVLPPLIRELSLSDLQFGVIMSASALVVAVTSPRWGRAADRWGRRRLMVFSLCVSAAGMVVFAGVVQLGLAGDLRPGAVFAGMLLARGAIFGGALAALPVAAQSFIAATTPDERHRLTAISQMGAAIGLALVLGPGVGAVLGGAGVVGALLYGAAALLAGAMLVARALPADRPAGRPVQVAAPLRLTDQRLRGVLPVGATIYLSTSLLQISLPLLMQDRLALGPAETTEYAGTVLLLGGVPMLLVQALVIPRLTWPPHQLTRIGLPVTGVAFVGLAVCDQLWAIAALCILSGIGHSLAIPGYATTITLRVSAGEQGAAAGLMASVNAAALVLGPLLATALYRSAHALPFIVGAALLSLAALVWRASHPAGLEDR